MKVCEFIERYLLDVMDWVSWLSMDKPTRLFWKIDDALHSMRTTHARNQDSTASWMIKTQAFPNNWEHTQHLQTKFPIVKLKDAYCGKLPQHPNERKDCECDTTCECSYCTACTCYNAEPLNLKQISPWAKPKTNSIQVPWGKWSKIVALYLAPECDLCTIDCDPDDWVFIEYYAWFELIKCLDDVIPVPDQEISTLVNYVASEILASSSGNKEQQSLNYFNKAKNKTYASKDDDKVEQTWDEFRRIIPRPVRWLKWCSWFHYLDY